MPSNLIRVWGKWSDMIPQMMVKSYICLMVKSLTIKAYNFILCLDDKKKKKINLHSFWMPSLGGPHMERSRLRSTMDSWNNIMIPWIIWLRDQLCHTPQNTYFATRRYVNRCNIKLPWGRSRAEGDRLWNPPLFQHKPCRPLLYLRSI